MATRCVGVDDVPSGSRAERRGHVDCPVGDEAPKGRGLAGPGRSLVSTVLTLTPYRRGTPERNRSIPTISAGFLGGRLGNVSAVDTSPRRSESGVLAARPGASVTGPSPPSPARRLRWGPVVMVGRRLRFESHLGSACSTRGGIHWPRVVLTARRPHLPEVPPTLLQWRPTLVQCIQATP